MPYNGSGTFSLTAADNPAVAGTTISPTKYNNTMTDLAGGLTTALTKDGQTTPTANIPMGGYKITNIANGTATTDAVNLGQLQAAVRTYLQADLILNGYMRFWQRGTSSTAVGGMGTNTNCDAWQSYTNLTVASLDFLRDTDVPTVAQAGHMPLYSMKATVNAADATVGANDFYAIRQFIEGPAWAGFAQQDLTLKFWVKGSLTGTYSVCFTNNVDKSYVGTYTISVANTWEEKTIAMTASPAAGTWQYTPSGTVAGLQLLFVLMAGTNFQIATGSWQNVTAPGGAGASTQTNFMATAGNVIRFYGVSFYRTAAATAPSPRSFEDELQMLQRRYEKSFPVDTVPAQNAGGGHYLLQPVGASATGAGGALSFKTTKIKTPTVVTYNPSAASAEIRNETRGTNHTGTGALVVSEDQWVVHSTSAAGSAVGDALKINWTADTLL